MNVLIQMILLMMTAAVTENIVFTRAIGVALPQRRPPEILKAGLLLALIVTPTGVFTAMLSPVLTPLLRGMYEPLVLSGLMIVWYFLVFFLLTLWGMYRKKSVAPLCRTLALATFNSAVLAVLLIVARRSLSVTDALAYGFGSAIGFTGATLLIRRQKNQAQILRVPKAFRGLPVTLIYIGILSLALYGLIGHQSVA